MSHQVQSGAAFRRCSYAATAHAKTVFNQSTHFDTDQFVRDMHGQLGNSKLAKVNDHRSLPKHLEGLAAVCKAYHRSGLSTKKVTALWVGAGGAPEETPLSFDVIAREQAQASKDDREY
jgi:hypothetical protein